MLMRLKHLALIVCLLYWHAEAWGQEPRVLQIGYYDFAPTIYTTEQGQAAGPLADLLERLFHQAGYAYQFKKLPIARLYNQLRDGGVDIWAGAPHKEELRGHVTNGQQQLTQVALNLYYLPETDTPKLPEDVRAQVMIVINGFSYWPKTNALLLAPERGVIQLRTNNRHAALELLLRKRGMYLLDYQLPIDEALHDMGLGDLPYVPVEKLPIVLVGSNKTPDIQNIIATLDQAYETLLEAGEDVSLP